MKDKRLEENIKKSKTFTDLWSKFNELYISAISQNSDQLAQSDMFIQTKPLINIKFEDLMDSVGLAHNRRIEKYYPVYEILSINDLSTMSDEKINRINECWTDTYIFLQFLMQRLKKKKDRIAKFNTLIFILKNSMRNRRRK